MRVLALEPYYGGSHAAFLDGWRRASGLGWTVLTAPAYGWKWRMRHAAISLAEQVVRRSAAGEQWDAVVCSDMLNLAEFVGLCPPDVHRLPRVAYFHENQLTYPVRHDEPRDIHFGLINMSTALAADAVWFNSAYHRDAFLDALRGFLRKMRPPQLLEQLDAIAAKACIQPPGIEAGRWRDARTPGAIHIGWAARWEHDKGPDAFFAALDALLAAGVDFRVSVIGEQFSEVPTVFEAARRRLGERVVRWGYQDGRDAYERALAELDVVVSTAEHEFFGLSMVEAAAAGAMPMLPKRLAYPEVFGPADGERAGLFYEGTAAGLAGRLTELARRIADGDDLGEERRLARRVAERYEWSQRAAEMDRQIQKLCDPSG